MLMEVIISGMAALGIALIAMLLAGTFTTDLRTRIFVREPAHDTQCALGIHRMRSGPSQSWTARDPAFHSQVSLALHARMRAQTRRGVEHRAWERWFERPSRRDPVRW